MLDLFPVSYTHLPTILCLASYYKGASFLTAAKALGARVLLLTREKNAAEPWPRESIDEVFLMPDLRRRPDIFYAVSYLTRANACLLYTSSSVSSKLCGSSKRSF